MYSSNIIPQEDSVAYILQNWQGWTFIIHLSSMALLSTFFVYLYTSLVANKIPMMRQQKKATSVSVNEIP